MSQEIQQSVRVLRTPNISKAVWWLAMKKPSLLLVFYRRANSFLSRTSLDVFHRRACPSAWKV